MPEAGKGYWREVELESSPDVATLGVAAVTSSMSDVFRRGAGGWDGGGGEGLIHVSSPSVNGRYEALGIGPGVITSRSSNCEIIESAAVAVGSGPEAWSTKE